MDQLATALTVVGATVLLIGLFSQRLKKSPFQEPLISTAVGILVGPYVLGWLDIAQWGNEHRLLERAAQITLAISLMAVALRLSAADLRGLWRPVTWLLTVGMIGMWLMSSVSAGALLGLPLWSAALLGAVVTPTDPVVASSIVTGKFAESHLPRRIRSGLSLESGANDGLAYLFVMLAVLTLSPADEPWATWLIDVVAQGVLLAIAMGAAIGFAAGRILYWAHARDLIESYSLLTFTVTLSLFTLGAASLVHADALISVFVAGLVFNLSTDTGDKHREERIQESVSKLFTLPMFAIFGLAVPFAQWGRFGWSLAGFVAAILILRRLPVVAVLFPALRATFARRDAAFLGWFGPIGVAAIYYAALAAERTGDPLVWEAASAVIVASILVHGLTSAPLTRLHARVGDTGTTS